MQLVNYPVLCWCRHYLWVGAWTETAKWEKADKMNRESSGEGNVIMKKIHPSRQLALKPGFGLGEETREQCCASLGTDPAAAAVSRRPADAKTAQSHREEVGSQMWAIPLPPPPSFISQSRSSWRPVALGRGGGRSLRTVNPSPSGVQLSSVQGLTVNLVGRQPLWEKLLQFHIKLNINSKTQQFFT